jgi:hydroxymethylbilane synthase
MALAQTEAAIRALKLAAGIDSIIAPFTPAGDRDQTSRLDTHGGKGGAFVGEIRAALRAGQLDVAMHSLKDMPGDEEAPGLVVAAYLKREAAGDALVLRSDRSFSDLRAASGGGFKIGTNAVRRAAYLRRLYPQAEVIHFRGAADTRLRKLDSRELQKLAEGGAAGPADALIMARSGLERIGAASRVAYEFTLEEMLPAIGQGIVALECRREDFATRAALVAIDDPSSRAAALAEREVLWVLNGHCNAPIAGHARCVGDEIHLRAAAMSFDGARIVEAEARGLAERPRELGRQVGLALLEKGAGALIEEARPR